MFNVLPLYPAVRNSSLARCGHTACGKRKTCKKLNIVILSLKCTKVWQNTNGRFFMKSPLAKWTMTGQWRYGKRGLKSEKSQFSQQTFLYHFAVRCVFGIFCVCVCVCNSGINLKNNKNKSLACWTKNYTYLLSGLRYKNHLDKLRLKNLVTKMASISFSVVN